MIFSSPNPLLSHIPKDSFFKQDNVYRFQGLVWDVPLGLLFISINRNSENTVYPINSKTQEVIRAIQPITIFCLLWNKVLLKHSHVYSWHIFYGCFVLQHQSWVAATETIWTAKPKIFIFWPFSEKYVIPWIKWSTLSGKRKKKIDGLIDWCVCVMHILK